MSIERDKILRRRRTGIEIGEAAARRGKMRLREELTSAMIAG